MRYAFFLFALLAPAQSIDEARARILSAVDATVARGPFKPEWNSLTNYTAATWYADAKFGIFIHWGVYSVPGFGNEWYPRNMYQEKDPIFARHVKTFGPQNVFGYKDFIPRFKAEKFDPAAWAALFKDSGARFVVPVAEHHDGFPMYDSALTPYCAGKMGPHRDIVGELGTEVRKQGLVLGASSHRAEHFWFFEGGRNFDSDVQDPRFADLYGPAQPKRLPGASKDNQPHKAYLDDWLARTAEIVQKYKPDLLWFDWWIEEPAFAPYLQRFAAYYYNTAAAEKREVAINYKNQSFPEKAAVLDIERGKLDKLRPLLWQTDTSIGLKSWGYIENEEFRSPDSLIDDLVDIVSKNGVLLLNIGPRPDGVIPDEAQRILRDMGAWLKVNGEAIYATRPWSVYGEGPTEVLAGGFTDSKSKSFGPADIRFTTHGADLYAISLAWPEDGTWTIKALGKGAGKQIASLQLLGSKERLKWRQNADSLVITAPKQKPCDYAYSLKIRLK